VAFALLTVLIALRTRGRNLVVWLTVSAALLMIAVLAMRWNVVIGGEELSKTMKGLLTFQVTWLGREGLLTSLLLFTGPFFVLWILARMLPPWEESRQG